MGTSVKDRTGEKAPKKYLITPCPECGHRRRIINGAYLRYLREKAGIDQRTFGSWHHYGGAYISDIERNHRACPDMLLTAYEQIEEMK